MRKPAPPRDIPPPLELECLKALWRLGEGSVRAVREALQPSRSLAYTTVMTVLDRLERRGAVSRRKQGRLFVYSAAVSRQALRQVALGELIEDYFDGSREALLAYLTERDRPVVEQRAEATVEEQLDPALL